MNLISHFTCYTNSNLKRITDLYVKYIPMLLVEENIGKYFYGHVLGKKFLDKTSKILTIQEKK